MFDVKNNEKPYSKSRYGRSNCKGRRSFRTENRNLLTLLYCKFTRRISPTDVMRYLRVYFVDDTYKTEFPLFGKHVDIPWSFITYIRHHPYHTIFEESRGFIDDIAYGYHLYLEKGHTHKKFDKLYREFFLHVEKNNIEEAEEIYGKLWRYFENLKDVIREGLSTQFIEQHSNHVKRFYTEPSKDDTGYYTAQSVKDIIEFNTKDWTTLKKLINECQNVFDTVDNRS